MKEYHVTGLYYQSNRRFKTVYSDLYTALGINLWRGTVWEVVNGKRTRIKSVWN
jgi:hypothetical protein